MIVVIFVITRAHDIRCDVWRIKHAEVDFHSRARLIARLYRCAYGYRAVTRLVFRWVEIVSAILVCQDAAFRLRGPRRNGECERDGSAVELNVVDAELPNLCGIVMRERHAANVAERERDVFHHRVALTVLRLCHLYRVLVRVLVGEHVRTGLKVAVHEVQRNRIGRIVEFERDVSLVIPQRPGTAAFTALRVIKRRWIGRRKADVIFKNLSPSDCEAGRHHLHLGRTGDSQAKEVFEIDCLNCGERRPGEQYQTR